MPLPDPSPPPSDDQAPVIPGTLLLVAGIGVLLCGDSGSGKSDAVLGLLDRGHRLVADDAVALRQCDGRLRGASPARLRGLVAARGLGLVEVATLFGPDRLAPEAELELLIELRDEPPAADGLAVARSARTIMATSLPALRLPLGRGRDTALLIELAVRQHRLPAAPQRRLFEREQGLEGDRE